MDLGVSVCMSLVWTHTNYFSKFFLWGDRVKGDAGKDLKN